MSFRWLPNAISLLRIVLIAPILLFVLRGDYALALVLFVIAGGSDGIDGYLAVRFNWQTRIGALLDPVADKLMVASALVLLVFDDPRPWITVAAVIIVGREITISSLREWMAELGKRATVAVSMIGKFKTAAQMAAITLLLWRDDLFALPVYDIGLVLLYIAAALTLWSMFIYLRAAWPILKDDASH